MAGFFCLTAIGRTWPV